MSSTPGSALHLLGNELAAKPLPPTLIETIKQLMSTAETAFGAKSGAAKKAWVIKAVLDIAKATDIPFIPNNIESVAEPILIPVIIEILWATFYKGK